MPFFSFFLAFHFDIFEKYPEKKMCIGQHVPIVKMVLEAWGKFFWWLLRYFFFFLGFLIFSVFFVLFDAFYPIWFVLACQICVSFLLYCSWHLWEPGTSFVPCVVCKKAQKMATFGPKMVQNSQNGQ